VNNTVKALSKKRKHQTAQTLILNILKASILKYQALWYSSFIATYIWFLYWLSYDFFVWHKPFSEINIVNYVGAIASIAFIWAGTKIWKPNRIKAGNQQQLLQQKPPQKAVPANSICTHYLGYLHQRQKQQEIPAECLTCEKLLQCMGSTN